MANGRNGRNKAPSGRDSGGFAAIPWAVLDCPAYALLSHTARSLLLEIARQYVRDNNGRLLTSQAYLGKRGWKSSDVIQRAKRELIAGGFICEMVKGHRPNKASWYAITWQTLDRLPGFDPGATAAFERGAYRKTPASNNDPLTPSHGADRPAIAPSHGAERPAPTPSHGAIGAVSSVISTPPHGDHLDKPSAILKREKARQAAQAPPIRADTGEECELCEPERVRECDQDAAMWDEAIGGCQAAPLELSRRARAGAESWVKAALSARDSAGPDHKVMAPFRCMTPHQT